MPSRKISLGMGLVLLLVVTTAVTMPRAQAQNEKVLYNFFPNGNPPFWPSSGVIFDKSGNLYGVTSQGGTYNLGTVYELSPTGSGNWAGKVLHSFGQGTDGQTPTGNLIIDNAGNLYGTTVYGGTGTCGSSPAGCGTVFELIPGSGGTWTEKRLHSFTGSDGDYPQSGVIMDASGNLYGAAAYGGALGSTYNGGTVFELTPSGGSWGLSVLHNFGGSGDGTDLFAGLTLDASGNLYGTTGSGGAGSGIVFNLVKASAWAENILYTFTDGGDPQGNLIFDAAGNIYGTTAFGGTHGAGSVFELAPAGGGTYTQSTLFSFWENGFDGAETHGAVVMDTAGNLYGTAEFGGIGGSGVVYELTPAGGGTYNETVLRNFSERAQYYGYLPQWNLIFDSSGKLYGTTRYGGSQNGGTVFELTP